MDRASTPNGLEGSLQEDVICHEVNARGLQNTAKAEVRLIRNLPAETYARLVAACSSSTVPPFNERLTVNAAGILPKSASRLSVPLARK